MDGRRRFGNADRLLDLVHDLLAFVATVLRLLVIPPVLDRLDALQAWWSRQARSSRHAR